MANKKQKRAGYVVYAAPTTVNTRTISKDDWASVGIEHPTLFWGPYNNWQVPAKDISDEAWPHIEADPGLTWVEGNDSGASVPESQARGTDTPGGQ